MPLKTDNEGVSTWEDVTIASALPTTGTRGGYTMTMTDTGDSWYTNADGNRILFNQYNEQITYEDVYKAWEAASRDAENKAAWERSKYSDGENSGGFLRNLVANGLFGEAEDPYIAAAKKFEARDADFIKMLIEESGQSEKPYDTPAVRDGDKGMAAPAAAAPIPNSNAGKKKESRRESVTDTTSLQAYKTTAKYKKDMQNMSGLNESAYKKSGLNTTGM